MAIVLLSTQACHLCELAQVELQRAFSTSAIQSLSQQYSFDVFLQDIIDQPQWLEMFAEKIPVLLDESSTLTLEWPFSSEDVVNWLEKVSAYTGPVSR